MQTLWQDIRYASRMLWKKPGFTAVAVITLALGIGANTAIFSVVNAVLMRPLPYKDADRLAMLWTDNPRQNIHEEGTSYPTFLEWRSQNHSFADMAICSRGNPVTLTGLDEPERMMGEFVSANLFSLLGAEPVLGRAFSADEEQRRERVVVLSYGLWQRRFGADPQAIGRTFEINGQNAQVIGVMPADFYFPTKETQLWEPTTSARWWERDQAVRFTDTWRVVGRLKPNVNFRQAQAEMSAIGQRLAQACPTTDDDFAGFGVNVVPMLVQITGQNLRLALWVLLGAVGFILLIACANVANLLLARGAARERELAIRAALGASRARLVRQLITESAVLALGSGLLGLLLAAWGVEALVAFAPQGIPRLDEISIDTGVLIFTVGLSLLAGMLFGLAPALNLSRSDPNQSLKEGGRSAMGGLRLSHTRGLLVVVEVALAVVLLTGAGLLIRSFLRLQSVEPGFDPEGVLLARVSLPQSTTRTAAQTEAFFQQIIERVGGLPGVRAAGAIEDFLIRRNPDNSITVEGRQPVQDADQLIRETVSPGFFQAMAVPLLRGRFFAEQDTRAPRAAIINETLARRFFVGEDPIGKRFKFGGAQSSGDWYVIVGVVGDMHRQGLEKRPISEVFRPGVESSMDLAVRVNADPLQLAAAVRDAVRSVDKTATVYSMTTAKHRMEESQALRRFQTWLLALFAVTAIVLAAVGIYGITHYAVAQRTHEIGIRMALGAQTGDVLRLVVKQGMMLVLIGIAIGLAAAFALTRVMASLLYGVSATDPMTFIGVALLLAVVALLACYIPARRATKVEPVVALRYE